MNSKNSLNIISFDPEKNKIEMLLKAFNVFYSKRKKKTVHETLNNCGNHVIKKLHSMLLELLPNISDHKVMHGHRGSYTKVDAERYRKLLQEPIELILYFYYKDSAYRDIGDYFLYHVLMAKDELLPYLEEKHPKEFYYNIWEDMKDETIQGWEDGTLPKGMLSESEQYLVDNQQAFRINKDVEEAKKKHEKNRHW